MGNKERGNGRFPPGTTFTCVPVDDPFHKGGSEIIMGPGGKWFRVAVSIPEPEFEKSEPPKETRDTIYVQGRLDGDPEIVTTENFRVIPKSTDSPRNVVDSKYPR